jgi:hypothetical protein
MAELGDAVRQLNPPGGHPPANRAAFVKDVDREGRCLEPARARKAGQPGANDRDVHAAFTSDRHAKITPELTSTAILGWTQETGVEWHDIAPGKPQQNFPPRALSAACAVRS